MTTVEITFMGDSCEESLIVTLPDDLAAALEWWLMTQGVITL